MCSSALEAELQACLQGIRFALDLCQESFMVESDSAELVQMIKSKERDGSALGHLVEDLRMLFLSDRIVSYLKIPRLSNSASHELARFGMLNQRTQVWVGSVPDALRNCIVKDCNNSMII